MRTSVVCVQASDAFEQSAFVQWVCERGGEPRSTAIAPLFGGQPGIFGLDAVRLPCPDDLLVGHADIFHMPHLPVVRMQAVGYPKPVADNHGFFQMDGVVLFFVTLWTDAVELKVDRLKLFAGAQQIG